LPDKDFGMKERLKLIGGFATMIIGFAITLPLPEFGIPMVLIGTRLLGNKYKWAKTVNQIVDSGWIKVKAWFKKLFRR
jgi:hypothetical protein